MPRIHPLPEYKRSNEVLAREGIDTSISSRINADLLSGSNEVLAREGIDTNIRTLVERTGYGFSSNEVLAREGIDTLVILADKHS